MMTFCDIRHVNKVNSINSISL